MLRKNGSFETFTFKSVYIPKCVCSKMSSFWCILSNLSYNYNIIILLFISFQNRNVTKSLRTNLVCIPLQTSVNELRQPDVDLPSLSCPTPCDYYPKMWASLFFITFTAFSLSCLAFVVHLCRSERLRGALKRGGLLYRPA